MADSAANLKVLKMLVGLDPQFFALRFVLSVITSPHIFKSGKLDPENPIYTKETAVNPQLLLSPLIQCLVGTFCKVNILYCKTINVS